MVRGSIDGLSVVTIVSARDAPDRAESSVNRNALLGVY